MINERSKLFNFLKGMAEAGADAVFPVKAEEERVCVKIPFPDDYPEYEKGLIVMLVITCIERTKKFAVMNLI